MDFRIDGAVITSGRSLETVLTGIPDGAHTPVGGGVAAEAREVLKQLDEVLAAAGVDKTAVASARLDLQHVNQDIAAVNAVYYEYFGKSGMLIEAGFVAELP